MRDYFKVLLVAASGSGKTFSARNLNRETTGLVNIENKPLPFKGAFKHHDRPETAQDCLESIKKFAKDPEIDCIFVDSFSAFVDLALAEARTTKKGYDIWNYYNDYITLFNSYVKKCKKEVFITTHYEILNIEAASEKRAKVKGKEWEGMVEKEYTMVLYADKKFDDKGKAKYYFTLAGEGLSAKCPPHIFGEEVIQVDNDANLVFQKIRESFHEQPVNA